MTHVHEWETQNVCETCGAREAAPLDGLRVKTWLVQLTCCDRADGVFAADSWEEAQAFRESYTSGPGIKGGHIGDTGHDRSAVIINMLEPVVGLGVAAPPPLELYGFDLARPGSEVCVCACHPQGHPIRAEAAPAPLDGLTVEGLKEVPTVKALTRRLGTFNEAWWQRFADEILIALRDEGETT